MSTFKQLMSSFGSDGSISHRDAAAAFNEVDTNSSGKIDTAELTTAVRAVSKKAWPQARIDFMMKKFDADSDGELNLAEFEALLQNFEMKRHADAVDFIDRCFVQTPWVVRRVLATAVRRRMTDPRLQRVMARFGPHDMLRGGELASIRAPTLLVWGDEERLLPESVLEFFKAHLPAGTRVERWSRFGHAGFLEQPRVIAQRIVGFSRDGAMSSWGPQRLPWATVDATLASSP